MVAGSERETSRPVVVVGGGLAGLVVARELHQRSVDFQLAVARVRLGGRILTVGPDGEPARDGFDLGPSWFRPRMQVELGVLAAEPGLATVPQKEAVVALPTDLASAFIRFGSRGPMNVEEQS